MGYSQTEITHYWIQIKEILAKATQNNVLYGIHTITDKSPETRVKNNK